jgi:hypothetical protein
MVSADLSTAASWSRRTGHDAEGWTRVRTCKLGLSRLAEETAWIEQYRRLWATPFHPLDQTVEELKPREKFDGRKQTE